MVYAANGQSMQITHTGSSQFISNNKIFVINDILTVPLASKNLLSVKQFCVDNSISIEFCPLNVIVKDLATEEVLFEGD